MRTLVKRILVVAGGVASLGLLIVAGLAWRLAPDAKARVEAAASAALGMEVRIRGRFTVGVLHGLHFALAEVRVRRCGTDVATAERADFKVDALALLHRAVRIEGLRLKGLRITLETGGGAEPDVAEQCHASPSVAAFGPMSVSVADASLKFTDQLSGKYLEAVDCEGSMSASVVSAGEGRSLADSLSLVAQVACGQVRTKELTASAVNFSVHGSKGIFDFDPVSMHILGGAGSGSVHADYSGVPAHYQLRYRVEQFRIDEAFKALSLGTTGQGLLDFNATLTLSGANPDEWLETLAGDASLHGADLEFEVGDLDRKFSRFESSQNFNLVDVGAVFFLGPLGLGLTKGLDFARALRGADGSTTFKTVVSEWQVEHGVAQAKDVAMTTPKNRIALKGGLDFVTGRFAGVTLALVDRQGCASVEQRVNGPFLAPQVEQPSVFTALTGPTRHLIGRVRSALGAKCEVFYAGSVPPPP